VPKRARKDQGRRSTDRNCSRFVRSTRAAPICNRPATTSTCSCATRRSSEFLRGADRLTSGTKATIKSDRKDQGH
jgi:hypothetical protein